MRERFRSILMVVGGAAFTFGGLALIGLGHERLLGIGLVAFFGAVTIVGLFEVLPGQGLPPVILPVASVMLGVGCAVIGYLAVTDPEGYGSSRYPMPVILVVSIVGAVFFGLGGLAALVLILRGRRAVERED